MKGEKWPLVRHLPLVVILLLVYTIGIHHRIDFNSEAQAAPQALASAAFSFGAAGDHDAGPDASASLDLLAASSASFYLALGDLSYGGRNSEPAWCDFVKSHVGPTFPFELVSGNHEDNGGDGLIENFAACLPDQIGGITGEYAKEYYFDYPAVNPLARFILISPDLNFGQGQNYQYTVGSAHYNWVASAIDGARAAGIPWVIVGMHKVCITMGNKSCEIRADLMNLLLSRRVDLVLQGHDHNYQRSKQLTCATVDAYSPACVADDGADNLYIKDAGTVFVIGGMFGTDFYDISPGDSEAGYFAAWMGGNSNPTHGFVKYTVSDTEIVAQFLASATGSFTDGFAIRRPIPTPIPTNTPTPTASNTPTATSTSTPTPKDITLYLPLVIR